MAQILFTPAADTSGLVTSVSGAAPITSSGGTTPTIGLGTVGVANGGTGLTTTPTNGQLLIGNGAGYTQAALTAGSGISITNGAGSVSIASTGGAFSFNQALNFGSSGTLINCGAFYSDAITPTTVQALLYSVNTTQAQVQITTTAGVVQVTMSETAGALGYRSLSPVGPIAIAAGWKLITLTHTVGPGQTILYGLRIA